MKKSLLVVCTAISIIAIFQSSIQAPKSLLKASGSGIATQTSCTSCHGSAVSGGSITLVGLPTKVTAGQSYTFSVHLNDAKTTAKDWGFAMTFASGTLSTTNAAVGITSGKLNCYHQTPPFVTDTAYTFDKITWTAPATAGTVAVKFAGIAGNGDMTDNSADHSYKGTASLTVSLPTPVKIASFEALLASNKVNLKWSSASELNTESFIVERSIDGSSYSIAGTLKAVGNSTTLHAYSFTDDVSSLIGNVYYRLKIIDKNGTTAYSEVQVVSVKANQSKIVKIYPNPLRQGQNLNVKFIAMKSDNVTFSLITSSGSKVANLTSNVNEGINNITLNFDQRHLSKGTYYLTTNNSQDKHLVVIQ